MNEEINTTNQEKRTWSAKIPDNLRERIEDITDATGMKGEELLTNLIESFDLSQTKLSAPKFEQDINNLETYTSGIISCIKNVVETAVDMEKINEEKYQKRIQDKDKDLLKIKEELDNLKEKQKNLDDENMKYWKENRDLEETLKSIKNLEEEKALKNKEIMDLKDTVILEREEKIKDLNELVVNLTSEVEKNKKYQEEISTLKEDISLANKRVAEKENEIKAKEIEVDGLKSQIDFFKDQLAILKAEYKDEIKELKASMEKDFENRIKELKLSYERELKIKLEDQEKSNDKIIKDLESKLEELEEPKKKK